MGSGQVLRGLMKKIDSEAQTPFNINALDDIRTLQKTLNSSAK
jgi:hypothetical protein